MYGFQDRFVKQIQDGTKRQTIRAVGRRKHAQRGDALQLYARPRQKGMYKIIDDPVCRRREQIVINVTHRGFASIEVDGQKLTPDEVLHLARQDGFLHSAEMWQFWRKTHGVGEFLGYLISW